MNTPNNDPDPPPEIVIPVKHVMRALEPRVLLDAAGAATAVETAEQDDSESDTSESGTPPAAGEGPPAREVAFVSGDVEDADALCAGMRDDVEVIRIGADADGIAVITDVLKTRSNLTAVHIFSHGEAGALDLGGQRLDMQAMALRVGELSHWSEAFAAEADLMIYGCDVGRGADGAAFLSGLSALIEADIAASEDITGADALGGDWDLEQRSGAIEAESALTEAAQADYAHTLAPGDLDVTGVMSDGGHVITDPEVVTGDPVWFGDMARMPDGRMVLVWTDESGVGGDGQDVRMRFTDENGHPVGEEIAVNTSFASDQSDPQVEVLADGRIFVIWSDWSSGQQAICGQMFDADGSLLGAEWPQLDLAWSGHITSFDMLAASNGDIFIAVTHQDADGADIRFSRFNVARNEVDYSIGGVAGPGNLAQTSPSLAELDTGEIAITYNAETPDGENAIETKIIDPVSMQILTTISVNEHAMVDNGLTDVAALSGGRMVVIWSDAATEAVYFRMFDRSGTFLTEPTRVINGFEPGARTVTALAGGGFAIAWQNDLTNRAELRVYNDDGVRMTEAVNATDNHAVYGGLPFQAIDLGGGRIGLGYTIHAHGDSGVGMAVFDVQPAELPVFIDGGIADRDVTVDKTFAHFIDTDSFVSFPGLGGLTLTATLEDGMALPGWLRYYPDAQKFVGTAPDTLAGQTLTIRVVAEDALGNTAQTTFDLNIEAGDVYGEAPADLLHDPMMGSQGNPDAVALANGGYVLVFEDGGGGIYAQYLNADGSLDGSTLLVGSGAGREASVAALADGGCVVTWQEDSDIYMQRLNADGAKVGGMELVNTTSADRQVLSTVAVNEDGGFLVCWVDEGDSTIKGQAYGADFARDGGEIQIAPAPMIPRAATWLELTALEDGRSVAIWTFHDPSAGGLMARFRTIEADGSLGAIVEMGGRGDVMMPAVASRPDGGFWVSYRTPSDEAFLQAFDAAGAPLAPAQRIASVIGDAQTSVTGMPDGGAIVVYTYLDFDSFIFSTRAQIVGPDGVASGDPIVLAPGGPDYQFQPVIARADNGDLLTLQVAGADFGDLDIVGRVLSSDSGPVGPEGGLPEVDDVPDPLDASVNLKQIFALELAFVDPDGEDTLRYGAALADGSPLPDWMTFETWPGFTLVVDPPPGSEGRFDIVVTATDDTEYSVDATFQLTVGADPDALDSITLTRDTLHALDKSGRDGGSWDYGIESLPDGSLLSLWVQDWPGVDGALILMGQRLTADGVKIGPAFALTTAPCYDDVYSFEMAHFDDGGFVVSWSCMDEAGETNDVYAQRFAADFTPEGDTIEISVNSDIYADRGWLSARSDGGFDICWVEIDYDAGSFDLMHQRYDAAGEAVGDPAALLAGDGLDYVHDVSILPTEDGGLRLVYQYSAYGWSTAGINTLVIDADGQQVGHYQMLWQTGHTFIGEMQARNLPDGRTLLTWRDRSEYDGSGHGVIRFHIFDNSFDWIDSPGDLIALDDADAWNPTVSVFENGSFALLWQNGETNTYYISHFDSRGRQIGEPVRMAPEQSSDSYNAWPTGQNAFAVMPDSRLAISFSTYVDGREDDSFLRVYEVSHDYPFQTGTALEDMRGYAQTGLRIAMPADAFISHLADDSLTFAATYGGGAPLPSWLAIDPATGVLSGTPPAPIPGGLHITVTATDVLGRQLSQMFHLDIGETDLYEIGAHSFRINTDTTDSQIPTADPTTALAGGGYATIWTATSNGQMYLQILDEHGGKVGGEMAFSPDDIPSDSGAIAALANGNIALTWIERIDGESALRIEIRDALGNIVQPADTLFSTVGEFSITSLTLEALPDGGLLAFIRNQAVDQVVVVDTDGSLRSGPVSLIPNRPSNGGWSIDVLPDASVVVVAVDQVSGNRGIHVTRFALDGGIIAETADVLGQTDHGCDIARLDDGRFVVTWIGPDAQVYAQILNADLTESAEPFAVAEDTAHTKSETRVVSLPAGGFLIGWSSWTQDGNRNGAYAQRFDDEGYRVGGEFRVYDQDHTGWDQQNSSFAVAENGDVLIVHEGFDGSGNGVYGMILEHLDRADSTHLAPLSTIDRLEWTMSSAGFLWGSLWELGAHDLESGDSVTVSLTMRDGTAAPSWLRASQYSVEGLAPEDAAGTYALTLWLTDDHGARTAVEIDLTVEPDSDLREAGGLAAESETTFVSMENFEPSTQATEVLTLRDGRTLIGEVTWFEEQMPEVATEGRVYVFDADGQAWGDPAGYAVIPPSFGTEDNVIRLAELDDGRIAVAWTGGHGGVWTRVLDLSDGSMTEPVEVGFEDDECYDSMRLESLQDGGFMVLWGSSEDEVVFAQKFDAEAQKVGGLVNVVDEAMGWIASVSSAVLDDGRLVTAALGSDRDDPRSFELGLLDPVSGTIERYVPRVDAYDDLEINKVSMGAGQDGKIAVALRVELEDTSGESREAILFGVLDPNDPESVEWQEADVGGEPGWYEYRIIGLPDGGYVLVFTQGDGDENGVYAQRFDSAGVSAGAAIRVNDDRSGEQDRIGADLDANGDVIVSWRSYGYGESIDERRFEIKFTRIRVNDGPEALGARLADVHEAEAFTLQTMHLFSDSDVWDSLTFSAQSAGDGGAVPSWLSFDPATGAVTGLADDAEIGDHTLRITATDSFGRTASELITVRVLGVNDAPVLVNAMPDCAIECGLPFEISLPDGLLRDADAGDNLRYGLALATGAPLPDWIRIDPETGLLSGQTPHAQVLGLPLRITATDRGGAEVSFVVRFTVFAPAVPETAPVREAIVEEIMVRQTRRAAEAPETATARATPVSADRGAGALAGEAETSISVRPLLDLDDGGEGQNTRILLGVIELAVDPWSDTAFSVSLAGIEMPPQADVAMEDVRAELGGGQPLPSWLGFRPEGLEFQIRSGQRQTEVPIDGLDIFVYLPTRQGPEMVVQVKTRAQTSDPPAPDHAFDRPASERPAVRLPVGRSVSGEPGLDEAVQAPGPGDAERVGHDGTRTDGFEDADILADGGDGPGERADLPLSMQIRDKVADLLKAFT